MLIWTEDLTAKKSGPIYQQMFRVNFEDMLSQTDDYSTTECQEY